MRLSASRRSERTGAASKGYDRAARMSAGARRGDLEREPACVRAHRRQPVGKGRECQSTMSLRWRKGGRIQAGEKHEKTVRSHEPALAKVLDGAWAEDDHAVLSDALPKNDAGVRPPEPLFPWMPAIPFFFLGLGLYRAWIEIAFVTPISSHSRRRRLRRTMPATSSCPSLCCCARCSRVGSSPCLRQKVVSTQ